MAAAGPCDPGQPGPDDPPPADLVFRADFRDDELSAAELEVLGSALPELIGELLQMTVDREQE